MNLVVELHIANSHLWHRILLAVRRNVAAAGRALRCWVARVGGAGGDSYEPYQRHRWRLDDNGCVTELDEPLVLGGRLAPLGCTVAFIDRGCDEVLSEITRIRSEHDLNVSGPVAFELAMARLDPMEAPWTTELVSDCGAWTGYVNNSVNGGDPTAIAPALARRMEARCATAVHMPKYGPGHASTQFLLDGPDGQPPLMGIRSLAAHCEDGRWSWYEWGAAQPFEHVERYKARLKRDRLDRELVTEYLAAIGIEVDRSDFFGRTWVVEQVVDWRVRRESVADFRKQNGWS